VTPRFLPRAGVLDSHGDHRAERDLEWPAAEIEVTGAADAGMEIDPATADPDRIPEELRAARSEWVRDVLLEDGELGAQASRLADVRRRREPVAGSPHDVSAKSQAHAAIRKWRFGLQPVQQAQAELPRVLQVSGALLVAHAHDRS
jgi:hypothetical protein